ncbi:MAG: sugar transferase, partial [Pseudomonadota bacterium]
RVLATLGVHGMMPNRIIVTQPHEALGRDAVRRIVRRAIAGNIPCEQLPDLMRFRGESGLYAPSSATDLSPDTFARVKRLFDVVVSAMVLIIATPLMIFVALVASFLIQRPVLFRQVRPGRKFREFELLKFRTMRDPVDQLGRHMKDVERTPAFGRFLRRSRIDELPQFWNVLVGDMAIIGPRPLLERDLVAMPDRGILRSRVRPGITGWAQVNGGHLLTPREKHVLDIWYSENASVSLDVKVILLTIRMMIMGEARNDNAIDTAQTVDATSGATR